MSIFASVATTHASSCHPHPNPLPEGEGTKDLPLSAHQGGRDRYLPLSALEREEILYAIACYTLLLQGPSDLWIKLSASKEGSIGRTACFLHRPSLPRSGTSLGQALREKVPPCLHAAHTLP